MHYTQIGFGLVVSGFPLGLKPQIAHPKFHTASAMLRTIDFCRTHKILIEAQHAQVHWNTTKRNDPHNKQLCRQFGQKGIFLVGMLRKSTVTIHSAVTIHIPDLDHNKHSQFGDRGIFLISRLRNASVSYARCKIHKKELKHITRLQS